MYLSIDVGATSVKYAVFSIDGLIQKADTYSTTQFKSRKDFFSHFKLIIDNSIENFNIESIGIGFPCVVRSDGYIFTSPNMKDFNDFNLYDELRSITNLPFSVDNDANVAALAELHLGNAKEESNLLYITLGTGTGGAIIIDRKIYQGKNGGAGEIGHLIVAKDVTNHNDKRSFRQGVLEQFTSKESIEKAYLRRTESKSSVKEIFDKAELAYIAALEVENSYIKSLSAGIASACNLLDISFVLIGGGISQRSEDFYQKLNIETKLRLLPSLSEQLIIKKAYYQAEAGLYGAYILAKQNTKQ